MTHTIKTIQDNATTQVFNSKIADNVKILVLILGFNHEFYQITKLISTNRLCLRQFKKKIKLDFGKVISVISLNEEYV